MFVRFLPNVRFKKSSYGSHHACRKRRDFLQKAAGPEQQSKCLRPPIRDPPPAQVHPVHRAEEPGREEKLPLLLRGPGPFPH